MIYYKYLLFKLLILTCLIINTNFIYACSADFYQGLDDCIEKIAAKRGPKVSSHYLPSERFVLLQQVSNIRFYVDQGSWLEHIPVQFQTITLENVRTDRFPQTFLGSLIRTFFPSPDGEYLVPNQAATDPTADLTIENIALIEKAFRVHQGTQESQINTDNLKSVILNIIGCKPKFTPDQIQGFQIHDFKMRLYARIVESGEQTPEEDLAEKDLKRDDPIFIIKFIELFHPDVFDKGYFNPDEVSSYAKLSGRISRYKQLSNVKQKDRSEAEEAEFEKFRKYHADIVVFEEQRREFYRYRIADTLVRSLAEENALIYPIDIVNRALLALFWKKVTGPKDIVTFYSILFDCDPQLVNAALNQPRLGRQHYLHMRQDIDANRNLDTLFKDPEILAFLNQGYNLYENPLPPLVPYRTILFQGKPYANCVEASLLTIALLGARRKGEEGYTIDPQVFPASSPLRVLLTKFSTIESLFSVESQELLGEMLAQRPNIVYLKPPSKKEKSFEVRPGFINALHCLSYVFDDINAVRTITFGDGKEGLARAFQVLGQSLSQKSGVAVTFEWINSTETNPKKQDFFGEVVFCLNGRKSLMWKVSEGHSTIKPLEEETFDWRKKVPLELVKTQKVPARAAHFLSHENVVELLTSLSKEEQASFMYAMDLGSLNAKTEVLKFAFRTISPTIVPFCSKLFGDIYTNIQLSQSMHTQHLLWQEYIWPLVTPDDPHILSVVIPAIVKHSPAALENGSKDGLCLDVCLMTKKYYPLVEAVAPHLTHVSVSSPYSCNDIDAFTTIFLDYLPRFKKVQYLTVGSLPVLKTGHVKRFLNTLGSLKKLGWFTFNDSCFDEGFDAGIATQFPISLQQVQLFICERLLNVRTQEDQMNYLFSIFETFAKYLPKTKLVMLMPNSTYQELIWEDLNKVALQNKVQLSNEYGITMVPPRLQPPQP